MKTNKLRKKKGGIFCGVYLDYCCGGAHGIINDNPGSQRKIKVSVITTF